MANKLRKMLGAADSTYIVSLMRLLDTQSKTTIAKWCMDYCEAHILPVFEKHCPGDDRPRHAIEAALDWLVGAQATARACGQATACFHTPTHSLGLAFYGSAAIAYDRYGTDESAEFYDNIAAEEYAKMEAALQAVAVENEPNLAKLKWNC